ncbi:conserved hypothetical protein [Rubrivivax sp. A210]|uniref:type II toxin-antitoxin system VapB family antitoxin n=1 Tax=Rubrivivax sp. A210 TaxID=2772301 RepID=UPI00191855E4|nr:type II toxin-antitoxin system VapB family antitoxin [Rubrivivax sp. A210]CAD5374100.1 conserved hypothetical protein [Rubrivivax sp. A210]
MRTNIDIDDALMAQALKAGPYTTKKDAVEAGLKLLARQAAYREILKWEGKLAWQGDESQDWTVPEEEASKAIVISEGGPAALPSSQAAQPAPSKGKRRAGR